MGRRSDGERIFLSPRLPVPPSPRQMLVRKVGLLATVVMSFSSILVAEDPLHLPVGDPARRDREAPVVLDGITETATGTVRTPGDLPERLKEVRLLFLGEEHTDMESHRIERRVLEDLARSGRKVLVGLEMYPYEAQPSLDLWVAGKVSEREFLDQSHWYKNWGYNWNYYRDIFLLAGEAQLPLVAVNAPREVVSAVRKKGLQGLSADEAAHLPAKIDTDSPDGMRLFRAELEGEGIHASMSEEEWKGMFAAQCAWDATFAHNAVAALRKLENDPRAILVLLIGSGHVRYGLGAQRQAAQIFSGKMASLVPVPVRDDKGKPVARVQASLADFVWGVPAESDPVYPAPGLSVTGGEGGKPLTVIHVEKDSVAERDGVKVGDVLVSADATPVPDREALNRWVAGKSWGDSGRLAVKRGGKAIDVDLLFRRQAPTKEP